MLTRRQTLAAAAGAALSASHRGTNAGAMTTTPTALPTIPADEDYELVVWVEIDLHRYSPRPWPTADDGTVTLETDQQVYAKYFLSAGRERGAWRLSIQQLLVEDPTYGEDIHGPALIDLTGQTAGPDPVTLLQTLLGGQMTLHPQRYVPAHALSEEEFAALTAASPAAQAATIRGLQDDNPTIREINRWILTASDDDLVEFQAALRQHGALG